MRLVTVKGAIFGSLGLWDSHLGGVKSVSIPSSLAKFKEMVERVAQLSRRAYTGIEIVPTRNTTGATGRKLACPAYARKSHSKGEFGF